MPNMKYPFLKATFTAAVVTLVAVLQPVRLPAAESQDQQLASLEAGVQAAEAMRAVKRLQHAYAQYQSAGLWSDLADLFTADGVGQFPGYEAHGKADLQRYFMEEAGRKQAGLAAGQMNTHLPMQPIVTLGADGKTAKGTWHDQMMLGRFGESASWVGVIYENDYVLDQGKWKIARIGYYPQYAGAFQDDGHKAPAKWNIPYHFEGKHVGVSIPDAAVAALASKVAAAPAGARAADLKQRLTRMQDETAVQNLQHAFGYYLDRKLYDDVTDLFASDGSMEMAQRGVYVGPKRIREALEKFYGPTPLVRGELFDHILVGTVVSIAPDGTHAAARTTQLAQLGLVGKGASWEAGIFENRFVKQGGKWKIAAVHYFQTVNTDYDKGWAEDSRPVPTVDAGFAPDRPPSQSYASFPALQSVGFSFPNPVTGRAAGKPAGPVVSIPLVSGQPAPAKAVAVNAAAIAELQRQLRVAVGVDATENLMSSYGYYIDESDWDNMAETYGSMGAKELTGAGVYVGTERIRKALTLRGPRGGRSATTFTIHQVVQPVITVSEDGTTAKARLRLFQDGGAANGSSGSWIGGIYENTAMIENGEWKFGIQDLHHIFNASYRNGWARVGGGAPGGAPGAAAAPARPAAAPAPVAGAAPAAAAAPAGRDVRGGGLTEGLGGAASPSSWMKDFPPDRKIRARQYAFPEIVEPAFHYANPVSGRAPKEWVNQ
jgi:hypothetical protein